MHIQTTFVRVSKASLSLALALGIGSCSSKSTGGSGTEGDTESSTGDGTAGSASDGADGSSSASASGTGGTAGDDGNESGGFIDDGSGSDGPAPPGPNGSPCTSNEECESMFCYQTPLGGACSECLTDMDCMEDGGSGTCSLDIALMYAVCTDGNLGDGCMTDEGCMGDLVCALVVDTGGLFDIMTCSECKTTTDCMDTDVCSPSYDTGAISGSLQCVAPGSVPNDQGCPLDSMGVGDGSVCESGFCAAASLGGFVDLGVCGECDPATDAGCMGGEVCTAGMADMTNGLTGATCGGGGTGTGTSG